MTTQKLTVVGPTWGRQSGWNVIQGKTTFCVHAEGCKDLKRVHDYGNHPWAIEASSKLGVVQNVYSDVLSDRATPAEALQDAKDWVKSEFTFAACVKLPKGF